MDKMVPSQSRGSFFSAPRVRTLLIIALGLVTTYFLVFSGPTPRLRVVPFSKGSFGSSEDEPSAGSAPASQKGDDVTMTPHPGHRHDDAAAGGWEINIDDLASWHDPDDHDDANNAIPGYEADGSQRTPGDVARLQHEKDLRKMWRYAYKTTAKLANSNLVYGNTLKQLILKNNRTETQAKQLREDSSVKSDVYEDQPVRFNPYPEYNGDEWKKEGYAPHVPCKGPTGEAMEDLLVYKGRPANWPEPKFGRYELFDLDPNVCWERDTRLGQFGLFEVKKKVDGGMEALNWDNVNWGDLQQQCLKQNAERFDMNKERGNLYLDNYPETRKSASEDQNGNGEAENSQKSEEPKAEDNGEKKSKRDTATKKEVRTAILLRSYTGMKYSPNDQQVIRALINELSLRTGGQYEVFLLVQAKDDKNAQLDDEATYKTVLHKHVPPEFHGITVLWNDAQIKDVYGSALKGDEERSVHSAQWLSVQKFSHEHPQFDYIWNWEMDFRYTGHHYDLLEKLAKFAKKQPRKYLWERNERWYIPEYHGDYDTEFREDVAERHGNDTVWGPPDLPFVKPVGPKPPVASYKDDNYEWGVGEEADFLTVGPMFDPIGSQWIIANHVWGYNDENHKSTDLPRRTTIVTQSRVSRRLLDIMHVENMRGNHVASEMTPQTVALLHGFKAVYAPHPVLMDRDWKGGFLNNWFNPGPNGECGGLGSPMAWGRERRYQGTTWYYRAEPPNRLYNNWMGWVDTGMGGNDWEKKHGRPCLPSIMLHPIKNTMPTKSDYKTGFELAFG